jgi:hypothetical protein
MSTKINDDSMSLEIDGRVIATASPANTPRPTARAHGSRVTPAARFTRNQAITAMVLAERLAVGYGDDDLFVVGWREELSL